jgi:FAD dependent oxidoreductase TIGR03364
MKNYDLCIVGGGALGAFHAYHALRMGLRVVLVERNTKPQSATVRNFGQVVPSGFNTKWQTYGRRSLEIYHDIQQVFDISARKNGTIYIASNEEEMTLLEELNAINKANDYPSELMSEGKCLYKYEGLREDYTKGGLFFPEEITLEPHLAIHRILQYLVEEHGLAYFPSTLIEEVGIEGADCFVAASDGGKFVADKVIVCNGSEFQALFPELFNESDLVGVKLQMLETVPQLKQQIPGSVLTGLSIRRYECFSECPSWDAIKAKEPQDSFAKKWGVHILFKQTTTGSVIIGDSHEYAPAREIDQLGFDLKGEINDFMIDQAKAIFNLENWRIARAWYGIYSQCRENDIFLHNIENRIHIVTGIGGKGMTGSAGFSEENLRSIYN